MKKRLISYFIAVAMVLSVLLSSVGCDLSAFEQLLVIPEDDMTPSKTTDDGYETTYEEAEETDVETEESKDEEKTTKKRPSVSATETRAPIETEFETEIEIETFYPDYTDYPVPPEIETDNGWYPEDTVEPEYPLDPVPPHDGEYYDDQYFLIAAVKERTNIFYVHSMENEYNVLADSAIGRDNFIHQQYGILIARKYLDNVNEMSHMIDNSYLTGDNSVQAFVSHTAQGFSQYYTQGKLFNLNDLNISLDEDYWNSSIMNDLSINGKLYAGLGDMLVTDTNVIAFNKDMANQYAIEGIYDLVYNGAWTLEELNRVINEVGYTDLNGDGMTDNDDMYGIVFNAQQSINSFMFSSDASPIIINYNMGSRELNMDDKFFDTFYFLKDMMNSAAARSTETIDATAMFTRSNSLFALVSTSEIGKLVNSDFNFGILPYPKADLAQVDYMSDYRGGYICVLSSIHDFDLVAASLDALNYYSTGMEDSLWMQALRSEDDIQMMNIVRGGLTCNFARAITASPFTYISDFYSKAITSGINIMAEYKSQELAWKNALHSYNI